MIYCLLRDLPMTRYCKASIVRSLFYPYLVLDSQKVFLLSIHFVRYWLTDPYTYLYVLVLNRLLVFLKIKTDLKEPIHVRRIMTDTHYEKQSHGHY